MGENKIAETGGREVSFTGLDLIQPGEQPMSPGGGNRPMQGKIPGGLGPARHSGRAVDGDPPPSRGLRILIATKRMAEAGDSYQVKEKGKI